MNPAAGDTKLIIDECRRNGLLRNQAAYVLGTVWHESAHTMKPIRERGGEAYLKAKPYYPYVGMGYVQLTWRENYLKASQVLGVDFVRYPKKLLEPKHAVRILVIGMKAGWFTGKSLGDYLTDKRTDFIGARRIVNGTDRAKLIAGYAVKYDAMLASAGYAPQKPAGARQIVRAPKQPAAPQLAPVAVSAAPAGPRLTKPLAKSRTLAGASMTGVGLVGEVAADTAAQIEPLAGYSQTISMLFLALSLVGIGVVVYARLDGGGKLPWQKTAEPDDPHDTPFGDA